MSHTRNNMAKHLQTVTKDTRAYFVTVYMYNV